MVSFWVLFWTHLSTHCPRDSPHGPNFCQMWQRCVKVGPRSLKCHQHWWKITEKWPGFMQNWCQKGSRSGNAKSNKHLRPLANHLEKSGGAWTPEGMLWAMVLTLQVGGLSSKVWKPVLARTGKLSNALQYILKFKLAASKKTDIVRCSSRFLDFGVQWLFIFCWAFATKAMPKPNQKHTTSYPNSTKMHLKITQNPLKNGALEGTWATLGPTCVPGGFQRWSFCTFGATLGTPGHPWGPTWLHFGALWGPKALILEPFGHHVAPLGWLRATSENRNIMMRILRFRPLWGSWGCHFSSKFQ